MSERSPEDDSMYLSMQTMSQNHQGDELDTFTNLVKKMGKFILKFVTKNWWYLLSSTLIL